MGRGKCFPVFPGPQPVIIFKNSVYMIYVGHLTKLFLLKLKQDVGSAGGGLALTSTIWAFLKGSTCCCAQVKSCRARYSPDIPSNSERNRGKNRNRQEYRGIERNIWDWNRE